MKITVTIDADSPADLRRTLQGLLDQLGAIANPTATTTTTADAKPATATKAAPAKQAAKAKDPEPAKEEPKAEAAPEPKPAKEEPKAVTKAAKAKPEEPTDAGPELPDNIKNTNSMRDLLTYLADHGVDSADAMVATCTVLKKDVPILSKVPNVDERVRRALDVLNLFAPEPDAAQA
jgi:hypothetical protein